MADRDDDMDDEDFEPDEEPEESDEENGSQGGAEQEGLVCDVCHKERATVHITDLQGETAVQRHLCKDCARKQKECPELDNAEMYAQLLSQVIPELKELSNRICPACKLSYLTFRHTGRVGCGQCYEAFDNALEGIVQGVHGSKQHVGKMPPTADRDSALANRIRTLEEGLREAVAREEYERAARLRDEIKALKSQMEQT